MVPENELSSHLNVEKCNLSRPQMCSQGAKSDSLTCKRLHSFRTFARKSFMKAPWQQPAITVDISRLELSGRVHFLIFLTEHPVPVSSSVAAYMRSCSSPYLPDQNSHERTGTQKTMTKDDKRSEQGDKMRQTIQ